MCADKSPQQLLRLPCSIKPAAYPPCAFFPRCIPHCHSVSSSQLFFSHCMWPQWKNMHFTRQGKRKEPSTGSAACFRRAGVRALYFLSNMPFFQALLTSLYFLVYRIPLCSFVLLHQGCSIARFYRATSILLNFSEIKCFL